MLIPSWKAYANQQKLAGQVDADEWRTIDPKVYTFACNGGPKQSVRCSSMQSHAITHICLAARPTAADPYGNLSTT